MPKEKEKIPQRVRFMVWYTYIGKIIEGKCLCCSESKISIDNFHCGHIVSEKNGGKVTIDNLRPICMQCNTSIGSQNMDKFIERYGFQKNPDWHGIKTKQLNNDESSEDKIKKNLNKKYSKKGTKKFIIDESSEEKPNKKYNDLKIPSNSKLCPENPTYDTQLYDMAFEIINYICPGIFKIGKIRGKFMNLMRVNKSMCIMSDRIHENDNAYLVILKKKGKYSVRYGCRRKCNKLRNTIPIGAIKLKCANPITYDVIGIDTNLIR